MKGHVLCFDYPCSETHTDIHVGLYERSLRIVQTATSQHLSFISTENSAHLRTHWQYAVQFEYSVVISVAQSCSAFDSVV